MATANGLDPSTGEKVPNDKCTAYKNTTIIMASAIFAGSITARRRKIQFKNVPASNPTPVKASGKRNALMDLVVRSKRCPIDSVYICGDFVKSSAKSTFGGIGGETMARKIVTADTTTPRTSKSSEQRIPRRRCGLPIGEFASFLSHIPQSTATAGSVGST